MAVDLIQASRVLTRALTLIGLWPLDPSGIPKGVIGRLVRWVPWLVHGPLTCTFLILMWVGIVIYADPTYWKNVVYVFFTEMGMLVKLLAFLRNAKLVTEMLHSWETRQVYALRTQEERSMWARAQRRFGVVSSLYIFCSLSSAVNAMLMVMTKRPLELPIPFWVPFDLHKQRNFWLAYSYEFVVLPLTCLINVVLDMLNCYIMLHVVLCLQLTGMRLEQIGQGDMSDETAVFQQLIEEIQLHQDVKRCARDCEKIVSYPILTQVLISSFVLCFTAYGLQTVEDPSTLSFMGQYAVAMILQCFLPCYYGNEVTVASDKLSGCLYNSQWIHLNRRNRRIILLYMEYLQTPIVLRAGYFFDIGLPLFSKIINNAYSLLALLLNMDK